MIRLLTLNHFDAPAQLNLIRLLLLKKYFSIFRFPHNNKEEIYDELHKAISSKSKIKTYAEKNEEFIQLLDQGALDLNSVLRILKLFFSDSKYNVLLLFICRITYLSSAPIEDILNVYYHSEEYHNESALQTLDDCIHCCDELIEFLHNILLDVLITCDYKYKYSKLNDPDWKPSIEKIKQLVQLPSTHRYQFLDSHKQVDKDKFMDFFKKIAEDMTWSLEEDTILFPAHLTLCVNRSAQSLSYSNANKKPFFISRNQSIIPSKQSIDLLSGLIAPQNKINNHHITRNNTKRLKKCVWEQFITLSQAEHDFFLQDYENSDDIMKLFYLFHESKDNSLNFDIYNELIPLLYFLQNKMRFKVNYSYFRIFNDAFMLNENFNRPLALLHLNNYTNWVDAFYINRGYPYIYTSDRGLYLKSLYCNKRFKPWVELYYQSGLYQTIASVSEDFNTLLLNTCLQNLAVEYYLSSSESDKLVKIHKINTSNDTTRDVDENPEETSFSYIEYIKAYGYSHITAHSTYVNTPQKSVKIFEWILTKEFEKDYEYLNTLCANEEDFEPSLCFNGKSPLADLLCYYYEGINPIYKFLRYENILQNIDSNRKLFLDPLEEI